MGHVGTKSLCEFDQTLVFPRVWHARLSTSCAGRSLTYSRTTTTVTLLRIRAEV